MDGAGFRLAFVIPTGSAGGRMRALLAALPLTPAIDLDAPLDAVIAPAHADALRRAQQVAAAADGTPPLIGAIMRQPTAALAVPVDLRLPSSPAWCWAVLHDALQQRAAGLLNTPPAATRALEQELELIKSAIVHNISHELNTPLLQIKSAVNQIERAVADEADGDPYIAQLADYATQAVRRLQGLVARVLRIARGIDIRLEPTVAADSLNLALRQLRANTDSGSDPTPRIHTQIAPDLPLVKADKQALGVLLELLIDNALKFSSDKVIVTLEAVSGGVRFAVCDTGVGIAPDAIPQIFDLFYQVDGTSTRPVNGAGIGLTIAAQIAERHGTQIAVTSKIGAGSTFSFILGSAALTDL